VLQKNLMEEWWNWQRQMWIIAKKNVQ
jgi:hypothetical protein